MIIALPGIYVTIQTSPKALHHSHVAIPQQLVYHFCFPHMLQSWLLHEQP
jgi:hypothetical protein